MDETFIKTIKQYVKNGGKLLSTGLTSINDRTGNPMKAIRLERLGVEPGFEFFSESKSTYLKVSEKYKILSEQKEFKMLPC